MKSFFLTLLLTIGLTACQNDSDKSEFSLQSSIKNGIKTYRHSEDGKPTTLDPIKAAVVYSNMVVLNIFDTLYSYKYLKRPYELKPNLATDMPVISEDGLTYTISIKQGVLFHDHEAFENGKGRELKAEDFIYSIKRTFDPANSASGAWLWQGKIKGLNQWKAAGSDYAQPVDGLKALDDYTIQITLTKPYPQLIYTLAMGFSAIVPKEVVAQLGQEFGSKPIGSGPFILTSFDSETAYFRKNPNFRQEPLDVYAEGYEEDKHGFTGIKELHGKSPPFIDLLEFHFIKESSSRWNSFTKGDEIQYTTVPKDKQNTVILSKSPLQLHPQITENFNYTFGIEAGFVYGGFNMADPVFGNNGDPEHDAKNRALRCAIRKAHYWDQKNRAFYFGLGTIFPGVITPATMEFDADLSTESIDLDVEGAKQLLAENDWTPENLPVFEYHVTGSVLQKQFFEQMRGFLNKIDYPNHKIQYHPYPSFGNFNKALKTRKAPYFFLGWNLDYPDAENTLQLFYGPNESPGSNNFNYHNPEFDRLYEISSVMPPSDERTKIYRQMNQMVIDDCVVISGLSRNKIHLWHKNVITFPDREILGGFHLRYVDVK
ncbi:MAG: ABC transporter substrate-binding protein [Proteobacteria bacterium]|nr:ABC transporter substrate-binding protein [Pseudomonadota bacterium]